MVDLPGRQHLYRDSRLEKPFNKARTASSEKLRLECETPEIDTTEVIR